MCFYEIGFIWGGGGGGGGLGGLRLANIARVNRVNYVIYPDGTHSKSIKGDIDRIFVNKKGDLLVQVGSSIITVEAGSGKRGKKKLS